MVNVLVRRQTRVDAVLDGVVLCGQPKRVKSDGEQDIISLHPALARHHFQSGIRLDMPDVHTGARRIRELHQSVKLGLITLILGFKNVRFFPLLLPFPLNPIKIVLHFFLRLDKSFVFGTKKVSASANIQRRRP